MADAKPSNKQQTSTYVALIAAYWVRTLAKFIIKSETKHAPIEYMKYTRQRSPLFSFHVVPIIVRYSQSPIPLPYLPMDGPLPPLEVDEDSYRGTTVTIELGSSSIRAGIAGNDMPSINIPSAVAITGKNQIIIGNQVGEMIKNKEVVSTIEPVIEKGEIVNWKYLKDIWEYVLKDYKEANIHFVISSCLATKQQQEKIIQMFFEEFGGESFALWKSPTLSLYASGRTTGLVVQSGYGLTEIVPIFEGYVLPHAVQRMEFCKYEIDMNAAKFDASMPWKDQQIGRYVVNAINKCDKDIRADLFGNIVLSGGNTMYDDIALFVKNQIEVEMKETSYTVDVIAPPERALSSWIGGSILGAMS
eukprot:571907_1